MACARSAPPAWGFSEQYQQRRKKPEWQKSLEAGGIGPIDLTLTAQASQILEESVPGGAVPATFATLEKKRTLGSPSLLY
jgi:hypothetical protein